jgi:hypothetical protein
MKEEAVCVFLQNATDYLLDDMVSHLVRQTFWWKLEFLQLQIYFVMLVMDIRVPQ